MKNFKISFSVLALGLLLSGHGFAQVKVQTDAYGNKVNVETKATPPPQGKDAVKTPPVPKPTPIYPNGQGKNVVKAGQMNGTSISKTPAEQGKGDVKGGQTTGGKADVKAGKPAVANPSSKPPMDGVKVGQENPKAGVKNDAANGNGSASNPGNGNAYGKNKTVEGREFGQQRAEEARSQNKVVVAAAQTQFSKQEVQMVTAQEKLSSAKAQVAVLKKDPNTDPGWLARTEATIILVEQKISQLMQQIKAGQAAVQLAQSLFSL